MGEQPERHPESQEHGSGRPGVAVRLAAEVGPPPAQPLAAGVHERRQVLPCVGVQRGQHLVGVHVRPRVLDRQVIPVVQAALVRQRRVGPARVHLDRHVVEAGLRAQLQVRVAEHAARHVRLDVELHDRAPVLQRDAADLADLHARHVHGLPLPGRHRLGVLELGVDARFVLPREAEALVDGHVDRHRQGQPHHRGERHEVLEVLPRDSAEAQHVYCSAGPVSAWRLGRFCFEQGAFGLSGGCTPV